MSDSCKAMLSLGNFFVDFKQDTCFISTIINLNNQMLETALLKILFVHSMLKYTQGNNSLFECCLNR